MSADESGEIRLWTLTSGRCQFILREKKENLDSVRLTSSDPIVNVWATKDLLVAVTSSARLLVWTHRSGHFRHVLRLGDTTQGAGKIFGEHFMVLAVDQSTVLIDLRLRKEKLSMEMSSLNSNELKGDVTGAPQTPKYLFLSELQKLSHEKNFS